MTEVSKPLLSFGQVLPLKGLQNDTEGCRPWLCYPLCDRGYLSLICETLDNESAKPCRGN